MHRNWSKREPIPDPERAGDLKISFVQDGGGTNS